MRARSAGASKEYHLKRLALAAVCAAAASSVLLSACGSSGPTNKDDSAFTYLLDRKGEWKENALEGLPALPGPNTTLYGFDVSNNTPLKFSVDPASLTVGTDGVVRYVIVITSPNGARNINYEGIRCDTYEWRLYASLNADHNGWDQTVANDWSRIENGELNAYQSRLYQDYFCANKMPIGKAPVISENIRFGRTQSTLVR
ncbi:CNP1-like family protein [Paraburkholderia bannensis]|uniref:CNP1-like family protein n=1 Tax=Paraburkholderia bannensis TaxID=765414 RepID=UPI0038B855B3